MKTVTGGTLGRAALSATAALMLASCQTTAQESAQGDAAADTAVAAAPPAKAGKTGQKTGAGYSDPFVVSMAGQKTAQPATAPAGDGAIAAYAPAPASTQTANAADLGELTMQPTAVNASRNSLFSQAPAASEPVAADAPQPTDMAMADGAKANEAMTDGAGTASSSIVPSDLPSRQINPMSKSLFSADLRQAEPPVMETASAPAASAEEVPVYEQPGAATADVAEAPSEEAVAYAAEPAPEAVPTPNQSTAKKRKWLPTLSEIFGKKKN